MRCPCAHLSRQQPTPKCQPAISSASCAELHAGHRGCTSARAAGLWRTAPKPIGATTGNVGATRRSVCGWHIKWAEQRYDVGESVGHAGLRVRGRSWREGMPRKTRRNDGSTTTEYRMWHGVRNLCCGGPGNCDGRIRTCGTATLCQAAGRPAFSQGRSLHPLLLFQTPSVVVPVKVGAPWQ